MQTGRFVTGVVWETEGYLYCILHTYQLYHNVVEVFWVGVEAKPFLFNCSTFSMSEIFYCCLISSLLFWIATPSCNNRCATCSTQGALTPALNTDYVKQSAWRSLILAEIYLSKSTREIGHLTATITQMLAGLVMVYVSKVWMVSILWLRQSLPGIPNMQTGIHGTLSNPQVIPGIMIWLSQVYLGLETFPVSGSMWSQE